MSSRPLSLLLVTEDRRVLRQLSRFLQAFGHHLRQVTNTEQAATALEGGRPDLLIVDADPKLADALELCRLASGQEHLGELHTLLMIRQPRTSDLRQALEAGVDDFLAKPVVYAELLVRLRAAARTLEFERRFRQQTDLEPVSGLPSRAAFYRHLEREARAAKGRSILAACVLLDIDFFDRINRLFGRPAGDQLLGDVAVRLRELWAPPAVVASLGGGQFAVLLRDVSDAEAAALAEPIRQALRATEFAVGKTPVQLTFSAGVASLDPTDLSPQSTLERAAAALQTAKNSGRDCLVQYGQFDGETKAWSELVTPGRLFERTVARDVMAPWTLQLQADHGFREAAALLHRTGLKAAPVVDSQGKYVGCFFDRQRPSQAADGDHRASGRVAEAMATDVPHCEEETSFSRLMEIFTQDACSLIVILHDGKPTGFVTAEGLASLGKPLAADSFASSEPFSMTSDYLRVADVPIELGQ
ncbi:MAG: diguanylate cyclase [Thermoguttaceae bacterium]